MADSVPQGRIKEAILRLDGWFDTMRGPDGYCGPVAHWWQDCLLYTSAGLDWRYEGIIIGYLNLYQQTSDTHWLAKARRAGDDLVRGQLAGGNYRNSSFELNPYSGGTPHEAACDLGLLALARVLKGLNNGAWGQYALVAERNLRDYHLGRLWDEEILGFGNSPADRTFTPNKSATTAEALFALAELQGDEELIERYALPTLEMIVQNQLRVPGHRLDGAIDQNSLLGKRGGRYFPFYNARCIPALLEGYRYSRQERFLDTAWRSMSFILRHRLPNGSFPQVIYGNGHVNRYPQWIAGVGDVLRAMHLVSVTGMNLPRDSTTISWLLRGQDGAGGIRAAHGFAAQVRQREPGRLPDFRDILSVCGWADKAFRYLTGQVMGSLGSPDVVAQATEQDCVFGGRIARYREDGMAIELEIDGKVVYCHRKGAVWAYCHPLADEMSWA